MEMIGVYVDDATYKSLTAYAKSRETSVSKLARDAITRMMSQNGITGVNRSICVGCVSHDKHGDDACSLCPCRYGGPA